jgi:hypothetical protein
MEAQEPKLSANTTNLGLQLHLDRHWKNKCPLEFKTETSIRKKLEGLRPHLVVAMNNKDQKRRARKQCNAARGQRRSAKTGAPTKNRSKAMQCCSGQCLGQRRGAKTEAPTKNRSLFSASQSCDTWMSRPNMVLANQRRATSKLEEFKF